MYAAMLSMWPQGAFMLGNEGKKHQHYGKL